MTPDKSLISTKRRLNKKEKHPFGLALGADTKKPGALSGQYTYFLSVPFSERYTASKAGARWSAERRSWIYCGVELPEILRPYRATAYTYERLIEKRVNKETSLPSHPLKNIHLRPHQDEAIAAILRAYRIKRVGFLLADEVGLGKTISTWGGILSIPTLQRILIVCPLAVCAHWRRTIEWMGDGGREIVVINYDRLQKLFTLDEDGKKRKLKGKARDGVAMMFDAIVWDECHKLKNPESARSKFAFKLNAKAKFRLWLSATAGSTPLHLGGMAALLAQMTGSKASDMKDFEKWCQEQGLGVAREKFGKWVWSGEKDDIKRVRDLLFGGAIPAGMRRRPEDIAGWPEINRILYPIDLEGDKSLLYEAAWREFRDALGLEKAGHRDPKNALAARLRFRQKSSLLRADGTADLVKTLRESGKQVAVSVAFQETLVVLREALLALGPVAEIHGRQTAEEKERNRLMFQEGQAGIVLFTVEEGISLHEGEINNVPRSQIIHDLRWSAIQMAQIEGRTHRDGKFSQMYWVFAPSSIDERIAEVVLERMRTMKGMVGDDTTMLEDIEKMLRESVWDSPENVRISGR